MAVSVKKLIYETRRKINSFNTGASQSATVLDLVSVLNEAYEIIVENYIRVVDKDPIIKAAIRNLEIKKKSLEIQKRGDHYFAKYPDNFYKRLNHYVVATCQECEGSKIIVPRLVQSDDLHEARKNPYRGSDYAWEQLLMDDGPDGLYIYTDNKMDLSQVVIDYYRKINYLQAPSLVECAGHEYLDYGDNLIVKDVDFDLDSTYVARKVSDAAALIYSADTSDRAAFELKLNQILAVNKLI